ncbi:MAG TPA: hypothetical protein VK633_14515, partial [Verrucomicrobiae bacterium]|nr:hypothetical protein [Verrucomicrobiae bacterium]
MAKAPSAKKAPSKPRSKKKIDELPLNDAPVLAVESAPEPRPEPALAEAAMSEPAAEDLQRDSVAHDFNQPPQPENAPAPSRNGNSAEIEEPERSPQAVGSAFPPDQERQPENHVSKPNIPTRPQPPQQPRRAERPDRFPRSDRSPRPEQRGRADRGDRGPRSDQQQRRPQENHQNRPDRVHRPERSESPERSERVERQERLDRPDGAEFPDGPEPRPQAPREPLPAPRTINIAQLQAMSMGDLTQMARDFRVENVGTM